MSIFDSEIEQFDNVDKHVANNSLNTISDFIRGYIPSEVWYNSFTEHNRKEIRENTSYTFESNFFHVRQHTPYITIVNTFYQIPSYNIKEQIQEGYYYRTTYSLESHTRLASLELIRKNNQYYICPNYVKWPIYINECGLDKLPSSVKFSKKNKKSKSPLTFIVRYSNYPKWIKDLPKGSIVYLIPAAYMTSEKWYIESTAFTSADFTKMKEFNLFIEAHGKKVII